MTNPQGPEWKAISIIRKLEIRHPSEIKIRNIAATYDLIVTEKNIDGAEGILVRKKSFGKITVDNKIKEKGKKRFVIAHELGHFLLHSKSQLQLCTKKDLLLWNDINKQEIEANQFAANLLMPENFFMSYLHEDHTLDFNFIGRLADEFSTTLTATSIRYAELTPEPCAVVISENNKIKWYKKSNSFSFHVDVGRALSSESIAFDYYDGRTLPNEMDSVPASAWLSGGIKDKSEINEHSIAIPRYNVVMSFLWINEDIEYEYENVEEEDDLTNPITPDGKRWLW